MNEHQLAVERRKPVVDDDVDPLAVLPDVEVEHAGVILDEQVVGRNHVVEQVYVSRGAQRCGGRQKPTVALQQKHDHGRGQASEQTAFL